MATNNALQLMPGEHKIVSSTNDQVVLTNYRVEKSDKSMNSSFRINIFLENISSMEISYRSHVWLLILGIISVLTGVYFGGQNSYRPAGNEMLIAGVGLGVMLILFFFITRRHVVKISSNGGSSIIMLTTGMNSEAVAAFMHRIAEAKLQRMNELHKAGH